MQKDEEKPIHVLMFPCLAFGHIFPFWELSRWLALHGLKVSFLSTPLNIRRLKAAVLESQNDEGIHLVELPLPSVDGLPAGAESTADIPTEQVPLLKKALDRLEYPFQLLLQRLSPDYVIFDFAQHWFPGLAAKLGITPLVFYIFGAGSMGYFWAPERRQRQGITPQDLTMQPLGFPPSAVSLQLFEARKMVSAYPSGATGDIPDSERLVGSMDGSCAIAIKACFELEGKFIEYLQKITGKLVLPVGPLVPDPAKQPSESAALRWLDRQSPSSVVFASFGSECFLTEDQIRELALALEAAGLPFLWVLRFPRHGVPHSLPEGFESRTGDRGYVAAGEWVPQLRVLSHPATGGFLTHCGWSSVLEGLSLGVPLIALPLQLDQGIYARQVVHEWKVGVEVDRSADGSFCMDDVRKAVRTVVVEDEGREVRERGKEVSTTVFGREGFQQAYIQHFIRSLRQLRSLPTSLSIA